MAERNSFGIAVCELLGIPPNIVRSIRINSVAGDVLTIDVVVIPKNLGSELIELTKKIREDERIIVNINWSRPTLDVTSLESKYAERDE